MKILVLDNYDSFVYNLVYILEELGCTVDVYKNDQIDLDIVEDYDKILLSPGPGVPEEAGQLLPLLKRYAPTKSILGVCLGHQAIAMNFDTPLVNLKEVFHGIASPIEITDSSELLFKNISNQTEVGRYHSWVVSPNINEALEITAVDKEGTIMALRHKEFDVRGVQFHPESILTPEGREMIKNWVNP